jgi:hypothetical protein
MRERAFDPDFAVARAARAGFHPGYGSRDIAI